MQMLTYVIRAQRAVEDGSVLCFVHHEKEVLEVGPIHYEGDLCYHLALPVPTFGWGRSRILGAAGLPLVFGMSFFASVFA